MPSLRHPHRNSFERDINHDGEICPICLSSSERAVITECQHTFCWLCLWYWLRDNSTCPVCRNCLLQARDHQRSALIVSSALTAATHAPPNHSQHSNNRSPRTTELGAHGPETILPRALNVPRSRITTLNSLSSGYSDSQSHAAESSSTENTSLHDNTSTGDGVSRGVVPTIDPQPTVSSAHLLRVQFRYDPTEYQPRSSMESGDGSSSLDHDEMSTMVSAAGHSESIRIDPQRMVTAMRSRANELAIRRGIYSRSNYWQGAKVVYKHWTRLLENRPGQIMSKHSLMWWLAQEVQLVLADVFIVDFSSGETIPHRLTKYLREVVKAGIDS